MAGCAGRSGSVPSPSMYYDRRIPDSLLALLAPGGPLRWLVDLVRSPWGETAGAHIQFRKAAGERSAGAIQVYVGRTSPLEFRGRAGGRLRLAADAFYRRLSPGLFGGDLLVTSLPAVRDRLEAHLRDSAVQTHRSFVDGEAVVHAGMMRRYGVRGRAEDRFVAIDSEAQVGFPSEGARRACERLLWERFGPWGPGVIPRKLDVVGLVDRRQVALVEVKADAAGIPRAAVQVAAHVWRFGELDRHAPAWAREGLQGLAHAKASVGLLGDCELPATGPTGDLVPVIAAPDSAVAWPERWRDSLAAIRAAHPGLLGALRLWRLSEGGEILDDAPA